MLSVCCNPWHQEDGFFPLLKVPHPQESWGFLQMWKSFSRIYVFFLYSPIGDFWKTNLKRFLDWACVEIPHILDLGNRTHVFAREGWLERNFHSFQSVEEGISSVLFPMRPRAPRGPGYRGGNSLDICLTCHILKTAGKPEVFQGQTETWDHLVAERAGTKWRIEIFYSTWLLVWLFLKIKPSCLQCITHNDV